MNVQAGGGGIPKLIHQIWLGDAPLPHLWVDSVKAFAKKYGYQYKLWTEARAEKELDWDAFPGVRREYAKFRGELAGRADIIRLLALYKYGGVYIDADSVVIKPAKFAKFLEEQRAAVFFGWEHIYRSHTKKLGDFGPGLRGTKKLVANGIIGAAKEHPFIRKLLEGLVTNANAEAGEKAWRRVGPLYVTRMWKDHHAQHPDLKIYPMRYFYPRHWKGITDPLLHEKVSVPGESMLFQYGYTTNGFREIFENLKRGAAAQKGVTRRRKRLA